jgi:hypothetical protein
VLPGIKAAAADPGVTGPVGPGVAGFSRIVKIVMKKKSDHEDPILPSFFNFLWTLFFRSLQNVEAGISPCRQHLKSLANFV